MLLPYSSYVDMIEKLENAAIVRLVEERLAVISPR